MWQVIVSFLGGILITGAVVLIRGYSNSQQSEANSQAAQERLDAAEKQAEADRAKRIEEVKNDADKITDSGSVTDALDQLRKHFPGSGNSGSH